MNLDTICVQGAYQPKNGEPRVIPIVQSTTFKYDSSDEMGDLFDLKKSGYFYSRLQNPTCDYAAGKIPAGKRQTFMPFSTLRRRATTLFPVLRSTAAHSTCLT